MLIACTPWGGQAMTKSPILALLVATTTCVSAPSSHACGDKLVPLGGGVRFEQIHVSRHPGKILLFLNPNSTLRAANDEFGLSAALVRAGHAVSTVENVQELEAALQTGNPDLVVMDWSDVVQLHDEVQNAGGSPPILPVLYRPTAEQLLAAREKTSCLASTTKRKGRMVVVQSVEDIMERRGKGLAVNCTRSERTSTRL
jgi:hypothetical protein